MRHGTLNVVLAVALALPAAAAGQEREAAQGITEREAAAMLLDDPGSPDVWRAIGLAVERGPRAGRELRAAVIEAAWAEVRREAAARAGVGPAGETDPDLLFMLFEAAEAFRDPRAIPLMIEALTYGTGASNALADLGAVAFPAVLASVSDPGGHWSRVGNGLTSLRFMVEDGSLSVRHLEQIRELVRDRLSRPQDSFVVEQAVELAFVLDHPGLRRTIERIAADRAFAEALLTEPGTDEWRTNSVQARAAELLSGAPPLPHRRRGR